MTAPRDPIEAPATDPMAEYVRSHQCWQADPNVTIADWHRGVRAIEAAARDEGRRDAVRLDVDALARAIHVSSEFLGRKGTCGWQYGSVDYDGEALCDCIGKAEHIAEHYEGLARHGRSSDPEPAPVRPEVAWRGTVEYEAARTPDLRERLAALEHEQWEHWSRTVAEQGLTPERIERWQRYWVPYADLDEPTKDFDREWADKVLAFTGAVPALQATGKGERHE